MIFHAKDFSRKLLQLFDSRISKENLQVEFGNKLKESCLGDIFKFKSIEKINTTAATLNICTGHPWQYFKVRLFLCCRLNAFHGAYFTNKVSIQQIKRTLIHHTTTEDIPLNVFIFFQNKLPPILIGQSELPTPPLFF